MAFKDLVRNIGGMFSRVSADITRRPDGGTSHYRPVRKKTEEAPAGMPQAEMNGMGTPYVHTGFTGMNPPADYGGYDQRTGYGQPAYGQTAYNQPAGNPTGLFRNQPDHTDYVGKGSFGVNNISYMPGFEPKPGGQLHVEHIITLTGLKSCYEAIECMKDGETLIVMLDAIANESESMRCQDMLAGAAFTLGCSVRLLPGARIVIIAPEGVKILPEQPAAEMVRPPEPAAAGMTAAVPRPAPRERRTGVNAAEWNAARNGELEGYNPYTGTMPVAAGAYGSFGGYGY